MVGEVECSGPQAVHVVRVEVEFPGGERFLGQHHGLNLVAQQRIARIVGATVEWKEAHEHVRLVARRLYGSAARQSEGLLHFFFAFMQINTCYLLIVGPCHEVQRCVLRLMGMSRFCLRIFGCRIELSNLAVDGVSSRVARHPSLWYMYWNIRTDTFNKK